jgi:hypothetical protein
MIPLSIFMDCVRQNEKRVTRYESGSDGSGGGCDCIGLPIGAVRLAGEKWPGTHGSNYTVRNRIRDFHEVNSPDDLKKGELVFKVRAPGEPGYNLPSAYDNSPLRGDYYHVGVVESVAPLDIVHCTSVEGGIQHDNRLGKWECGGELDMVDYGDEGTPDAIPIYDAVVTAPAGKTVNMRREPSMNSNVLEALPLGTTVGVLGEYDSTWSRIQYQGKRGYMMTRFLLQDGTEAEQAACAVISREKLLEMRACLADCLGIIEQLL